MLDQFVEDNLIEMHDSCNIANFSRRVLIFQFLGLPFLVCVLVYISCFLFRVSIIDLVKDHRTVNKERPPPPPRHIRKHVPSKVE